MNSETNTETMNGKHSSGQAPLPEEERCAHQWEVHHDMILIGASRCVRCGALSSPKDFQAVFTCDGCGCHAPGHWANGWHKPPRWYQRQDDDGPQLACSWECIDKIAAASDKTSVVLPI